MKGIIVLWGKVLFFKIVLKTPFFHRTYVKSSILGLYFVFQHLFSERLKVLRCGVSSYRQLCECFVKICCFEFTVPRYKLTPPPPSSSVTSYVWNCSCVNEVYMWGPRCVVFLKCYDSEPTQLARHEGCQVWRGSACDWVRLSWLQYRTCVFRIFYIK